MNEWKREGRHRLSMDLVDHVYERVKKDAKKRNITVTKWITRAVVRTLLEEEKYEKNS